MMKPAFFAFGTQRMRCAEKTVDRCCLLRLAPICHASSLRSLIRSLVRLLLQARSTMEAIDPPLTAAR